MPFKMITLSEKEVHRIAGRAGYHADLMANELTERWAAKLPKGQRYINVLQLQLCVRDDLEDMRDQIRAIEGEHLDRIQDTQQWRGVRDVAVPQLRGRLIAVQRLVDRAPAPRCSAKPP